MSAVTDNAMVKLDEALFYLELMDKAEMERSTLTGRETEVEFSYLLSAFLNACYSSLEHLKQDKANPKTVKAADAFQKRHPTFYKSGQNGGWRVQAVHYRPLTPGHDGYIPQPGHNAILRFREKWQTHQGNQVPLSFGPGAFYFSDESPQNTICDICAMHFHELKSFVQSCT